MQHHGWSQVVWRVIGNQILAHDGVLFPPDSSSPDRNLETYLRVTLPVIVN